MIESAFSGEVHAQTAFVPQAPVMGTMTMNGNEAIMTVTVPTLGVDGNPVTGLTYLEVFYKTTSMVGSTPAAERTAKTPQVNIAITLADTGQVKTIHVPNLNWGTEYFFVICARAFG